MNVVADKTLKLLRRKVYPFFFHAKGLPTLEYEDDLCKCQSMIADLIKSGKPCMAGRFGSVELNAVVNYLGVKNNPHSPWKYIKGEINEWWWNRSSIAQLQTNAGFFPINEENVCRFAEQFIEDAKQVDILGSWLPEEWYLRNELTAARKIRLSNLEPAYLVDKSVSPSWTSELAGKRVLVVHPFIETIKSQYAQRHLLFKRDDILPDFQLLTLKAVQSIGGNCDFDTWFDALKWMEDEMDKMTYDICLIGCGAYGLSLAAHAKRTGHQAIHLGGASQLMFGIKGRRWEEREKFKPLFNEYWVRPSKDETPASATKVENACYW